MKMWLPILFMAALCSSALAGRTLTLVSTDYPPYFASTLPEQGTLSALARAAFKAAGYDIKIVFRPWARLMKEVEIGQYDGVVAVWYKADRLGYLAYSDPIVDTNIGFYGRRDRPMEVNKLDELQGKVIGTVRGYANPPAFDAAKLTTEDAVDDLTNLRKLQAGRLDLVLIDHALAHWLVKQSLPGAAPKITWLEPPIQTMPLYVGLGKKAPDAPQLLAAFNRGLAAIHANGEYAAIMKRLPLVP